MLKQIIMYNNTVLILLQITFSYYLQKKGRFLNATNRVYYVKSFRDLLKLSKNSETGINVEFRLRHLNWLRHLKLLSDCQHNFFLHLHNPAVLHSILQCLVSFSY